MPRKHRSFHLAVLALLLVAGCAPAVPGPTITVEAVYPGANAQVLAETVAAPIEQQVNGVEKMRFMRSRSTSDGRYVLTVAFADGVDPAMAQVLVQNGVALALPALPQSVQDGGVTVKKGPGDVLFVIALSSPDRRFDVGFLARYAELHVKDELIRLPGVGTVTLLPQTHDKLGVWLDLGKMGERGLTAAVVARAIQVQAPAGVKLVPAGEKAVQLDLESLGRLAAPEELADIVVQTDRDGRVMTRLGQVARVERLGMRLENTAKLNGADVALLFVAPTAEARPRELQTAITRRLANLETHAPEDVRHELAFDFTGNREHPGQRAVPEYLLLDLDLPSDAAPERVTAVVEKCAEVLRAVEGVKDVLGVTDNPFDAASRRPCILLRRPPLRERKLTRAQVAATIRTTLHEKVPDAAVRLRFPLGAGPFAGWDYPIDLAIHGPDAAQVRKMAAKLGERLRDDKQLSDVWLDPASEPQPQLLLDIDRGQATKRGVLLADINETLQVLLAGPDPCKAREELKHLKVRNQQGDMVALSAIVTASVIQASATVDRFDLEPMVRITANPGLELSVTQARERCESLAREVREALQLPAGYRLSWIRNPTFK